MHNLRDLGLKVTGPRTHILAVFQNATQTGDERHLGAEEVHQKLLGLGLDVGIATVYRVLLQFEQAGIVRRSPYETQRAVYELNDGEHHDHIQCLDCGRVEEFVDPDIEARQTAVAHQLGFSLQDHSLSMYGHCKKIGCEHRPKS
jgi:Fur family transcriptional regulator, ferric uptake regulator